MPLSGLRALTPFGMSCAALQSSFSSSRPRGEAGWGFLLGTLFPEGHYGILVVWSVAPGLRPPLFLPSGKMQSCITYSNKAELIQPVLCQKRPGWGRAQWQAWLQIQVSGSPARRLSHIPATIHWGQFSLD